MKIIHEDETVRIFYEPGEGKNTLVCCSGVDFDVFGFDSEQTYTPENASKPEFVKVTAGMGDRFWIIDKTRSWGTFVNWEMVSEIISPYFEGKNVSVLGSCMGGTNAIKFAYHADIHRVIVFTPVWSIHPEVMPNTDFDNRISNWRKVVYPHWQSLEGMFRPMTTYLMFWTPDPFDIEHMRMYPVESNIKKFFLIQSPHSVAKWIRGYGILPEVLGKCIDSEDPHLEASKVLDRVGILHELF
jgi:hypothetical protein